MKINIALPNTNDVVFRILNKYFFIYHGQWYFIERRSRIPGSNWLLLLDFAKNDHKCLKLTRKAQNFLSDHQNLEKDKKQALVQFQIRQMRNKYN